MSHSQGVTMPAPTRTGADPHLGTRSGTQAAQGALSPAYLDRLTLAAIERRAAAADGPWTLHGPDPESEWTVYDATGRLVAVVATVEEAMLIADAPVDISRLLAEVRRLRAHHDHCAWGACGSCEDVALERDAAQAEVERLRVRVAALERTLAERMGATDDCPTPRYPQRNSGGQP